MSERSYCFGTYQAASNLCWMCADDVECEEATKVNAAKGLNVSAWSFGDNKSLRQIQREEREERKEVNR